MKLTLPPGILEATRLTRLGRLDEAAAALKAIPAKLETVLGRRPPTARAQTGGAGVADAAAGQTRFIDRVFANAAGTRSYKLFIPAGSEASPAPLIVMLHGCTQSPDDFALGTRMNEAAVRHGCLVAYPAQTSSANMQRCWNWFNADEQRRGEGEPSLIAGITRAVMQDHAVDPRRVYVAGLSAGGAAAAVLGAAYPDLYAAIGVHSGLACGAAHDMQSAFAAMQRGGTGTDAARSGRVMPAIVFHGDRDGTVNARNAEAVVTQSSAGITLSRRVDEGRVPGGHAWSRTRLDNGDGDTLIEQWTVHGGGHAWFGGSSEGTYTDPRGPDATGEMLRFFLGRTLPG